MSLYSDIYDLLTSVATFPVSPLEQQQQVSPPSIIYEVLSTQTQAKTNAVNDEIDLIVLIYGVNLDTAQTEAEVLKTGLNFTCTNVYSSIRLDNQNALWSEPNYIIMQRFRLKLK